MSPTATVRDDAMSMSGTVALHLELPQLANVWLLWAFARFFDGLL